MNTRIAATAAVLVLGGWMTSGAFAADQPSAPGLWQKQEYSFVFMGFTTTYSCDGLAGKLKLLLIAAGARADAKALAGGCATGLGRVDKLARADLIFYTLVPASDAPATAEGPPVGGTWRIVEWSRRSPRELELGDCELVEQFKREVLPKFATRNIVDQTTCVPHQLSGTSFNLEFESFAVPVPPNPKLATNPNQP